MATPIPSDTATPIGDVSVVSSTSVLENETASATITTSPTAPSTSLTNDTTSSSSLGSSTSVTITSTPSVAPTSAISSSVDQPDKGLKSKEIIAITTGGFLLIVALVAASLFSVLRKRKSTANGHSRQNSYKKKKKKPARVDSIESFGAAKGLSMYVGSDPFAAGNKGTTPLLVTLPAGYMQYDLEAQSYSDTSGTPTNFEYGAMEARQKDKSYLVPPLPSNVNYTDHPQVDQNDTVYIVPSLPPADIEYGVAYGGPETNTGFLAPYVPPAPFANRPLSPVPEEVRNSLSSFKSKESQHLPPLTIPDETSESRPSHKSRPSISGSQYDSPVPPSSHSDDSESLYSQASHSVHHMSSPFGRAPSLSSRAALLHRNSSDPRRQFSDLSDADEVGTITGDFQPVTTTSPVEYTAEDRGADGLKRQNTQVIADLIQSRQWRVDDLPSSHSSVSQIERSDSINPAVGGIRSSGFFEVTADAPAPPPVDPARWI